MGDQVSKASKSRNRLLAPGQDPAFSGLWAKFHEYMAESLDIINRCIEKGGVVQTQEALLGIFYLLVNDMYMKNAGWQAHLKGYLAYAEHVGGIDVLLKGRYTSLASFRLILLCVR